MTSPATSSVSDGKRKRQTPDPPLIAIAILNWNGWRDTVECLDSVHRTAYAESLVIVVENGSWDGSLSCIKSWFGKMSGNSGAIVEYTPNVARGGGSEVGEAQLEIANHAGRTVIITSDQNLGRVGGVNLAVTYALRRKRPADYVLMLDNDAKLHEDCVSELVELDRRTGAGIVGGIVLENGAVLYAARGSVLRHFFAPIVRSEAPLLPCAVSHWPGEWASGAVMMARRDVWEAVYNERGSYLHPGLFMDGEEVEFCQLARTLGYRTTITRTAKVWHKKQRPFGGSGSPMRYYYTTRNKIILAREILPVTSRLAFHVVNLPLCAGRVLTQLRRLKVKTARAVLAGLWDGYSGRTGRWKHHDDEAIVRG